MQANIINKLIAIGAPRVRAKRLALLTCAALTVGLGLVPQSGWAQPGQGFEPGAKSFVQPNRGAGRIIGLNQAIRIVQEESGGRVLSAKTVRRPDGMLFHRVRVLVDEQRVMTMVVDQRGRLRRGG